MKASALANRRFPVGLIGSLEPQNIGNRVSCDGSGQEALSGVFDTEGHAIFLAVRRHTDWIMRHIIVRAILKVHVKVKWIGGALNPIKWLYILIPQALLASIVTSLADRFW
jgi:hypothetical protein